MPFAVLRRPLLAAALSCALLVFGAASAHAWVYTSIVDFNLTESWSSYGTYTVSSSGDGTASYRWSDDPDHTTIISGNDCADLSSFGSTTISAHDTSYHGVFSGYAGLCFILRGRTATGAGSMWNHDGVLRR